MDTQLEQSEEVAPAPLNFHINVLKLVISNQRQHGLRHDDYARYRQFCTRRIHRLRKSLKCTHGNGKKGYQAAPIGADVISHEYHVHIHLLTIERAWSYAMEDKQIMIDVPRRRHHMVARLRKATHHVEEMMAAISSSPGMVDNFTSKQLDAYAAWIHGSYAFEKQAWQKAVDSFGTSCAIYRQFLAAADDDSEVAMYKQHISVLEASLKYCAYTMKGDSANVQELLQMKMQLNDDSNMAMLADKINSTLVVSRDKAADNLASEVTWLEKTVAVDAPRLRRALAQIQGLVEEINQTDHADYKAMMQAYDKLLIAFGEAAHIVKSELEEEKQSAGANASQESQDKQARLLFLSAYVQASKLEKTLERNSNLVAEAREKFNAGEGRPDDMVRLYDIILQNLSEMATIDLLEDDMDFISLSACREEYFRCMRCFFLAEVCSRTNKLAEALALFKKASERAVLTQSKLDRLKVELPDKALYLKDTAMIQEKMRSVQCEMKATVVMQSAKAATQDQSADNATNLDKYDDSARALTSTLVNVPPQMQPIMCKPLVYDLAGDALAYPSLANRLTKKQEGVTSAVGGMFKSLTGSWFG